MHKWESVKYIQLQCNVWTLLELLINAICHSSLLYKALEIIFFAHVISCYVYLSRIKTCVLVKVIHCGIQYCFNVYNQFNTLCNVY